MNALTFPSLAAFGLLSEPEVLPRYEPPEVAHGVALARLLGRAPIRFDAAGAELSARFVAEGGAEGGCQQTRLRWTLGKVSGTFDVPATVISRLIAPIEQAPLEHLSATAVRFLIELALAPQIEAFEALTGSALKLEPACDPSGPLISAALRGTLADTSFEARLGLPEKALDLLGSLADLFLPRERSEALHPPPIALAIRVGTARLGAALLATANPGDALLLREAEAGRRILLVAGERYAVPARLDGTRAVLEGPPCRVVRTGWEDWTMPSTTLTAEQDSRSIEPADATMDDLQVTLVFELGRRTVTLAELRDLAVGHIIEIGRDLSGPVSILANGQRIGHGELVRAGDALAVRILRLATHD